jgi:RHS repeat-associated protein
MKKVQWINSVVLAGLIALLGEIPVYGASRLGMAQFNPADGTFAKYTYELTDHLGNVRAVVSKDGTDTGTEPDLLSYTDYYAFGMPMPGRQGTAEAYHFAYQGQFAEKDPETGYNQFEARLWDSRAGRWLVPDPAGQYWSPYLGMGNNPIDGIDPDGGFRWKRIAEFVNWFNNGDGVYENLNAVDPNLRYGVNYSFVVPSNISWLAGTAYSGVNFNNILMSVGEYLPTTPENIIYFADVTSKGTAVVLELAVTAELGAMAEASAAGYKAAQAGYKCYQTIQAARSGTNLAIRSEIVLNGGRSGQLVKTLEGPANSVLKGSNGRIFITDDAGKVIWDITKDRAKSVLPGNGFGPKIAPTQEQLNLLKQVWGN